MGATLISAALQAGLVLAIAGLVYLAFGRKKAGFGEYVGLKPAPLRSILIGAAIGLAGAALLLSIPGMAEMASGRGTVTGEAMHRGASAGVLAGLAVSALLKTSFSEELLFRGIIGKRLIAWLGFQPGNFIQAALFGAVHLLLLLVPAASTATVAILVLFTGAMGWINGWLNERLGNGSILPGWAAHGIANLCAYLAVALAVV
jgi:membrane protease YdiL (CAAX protease family)